MAEGHGKLGDVIIYRGDDPQAYIEQLEEELDRLREENAALRPDAERYRWLNQKDNFFIAIDEQNVRLKCGKVLDVWIDAAIDAARKK